MRTRHQYTAPPIASDDVYPRQPRAPGRRQSVADRVRQPVAPRQLPGVAPLAPAFKPKDAECMWQPRQKEQQGGRGGQRPAGETARVAAYGKPAHGEDRLCQRQQCAKQVQVDDAGRRERIEDCPPVGVRSRMISGSFQHLPLCQAGRKRRRQQPGVHARFLRIPDLKAAGCQQQRRDARPPTAGPKIVRPLAEPSDTPSRKISATASTLGSSDSQRSAISLAACQRQPASAAAQNSLACVPPAYCAAYRAATGWNAAG